MEGEEIKLSRKEIEKKRENVIKILPATMSVEPGDGIIPARILPPPPPHPPPPPTPTPPQSRSV